MKQQANKKKQWLNLLKVFLAVAILIFPIGNATITNGQEQDWLTKMEAEWRRKECIRATCRDWGSHYNINPNFLIADIEKESMYDIHAVGGKYSRCVGLGQISETWQAKRAAKLGVTDLFDPDQNIHVMADFFAELFETYEDPACVLLVYRYGITDGLYYYENNNDPEGYADWVLERAAELDRIEEAKRSGKAVG